MSELKKLAVEHPYYCSESNYYRNEASTRWETMTELLDDMGESDVDMNLVFRWDIKPKRDYETDELTGGYYAEIFIIHQRKGIFHPCHIKSVTEADIPKLKEYLLKSWGTLNELWEPLSDQRIKESDDDD